jgi:DNA mismatch endonuclease (patch repair protein)
VSKDPLTPEQRSVRMALVRAKDSKPEIRVRDMVSSLGYRYESHSRDLPGCPDLAFRSRRKVIFVHGCFWHRHKCGMGNRMPKSRIEFWRSKLEGNKERDRAVKRELKKMGWSVLVIWECQTAPTRIHQLSIRTLRFLRKQAKLHC